MTPSAPRGRQSSAPHCPHRRHRFPGSVGQAADQPPVTDGYPDPPSPPQAMCGPLVRVTVGAAHMGQWGLPPSPAPSHTPVPRANVSATLKARPVGRVRVSPQQRRRIPEGCAAQRSRGRETAMRRRSRKPPVKGRRTRSIERTREATDGGEVGRFSVACLLLGKKKRGRPRVVAAKCNRHDPNDSRVSLPVLSCVSPTWHHNPESRVRKRPVSPVDFQTAGAAPQDRE